MIENFEASFSVWTLDGKDYFEFNSDGIIIHRLDTEQAAIDVAKDKTAHHWLLLDDDKDKYTAGGTNDSKKIFKRR